MKNIHSVGGIASALARGIRGSGAVSFATTFLSLFTASQSYAADTFEIPDNFDPTKGSFHDQYPNAVEASRNSTLNLVNGNSLETGDRVTFEITLSGGNEKTPFIKGVNGDPASVTLSDSSTLLLNGSGSIGDISGGGSVIFNSVQGTAGANDRVNTGDLGSYNGFIGSLYIDEHGGTVTTGDLYSASLVLLDGSALNSGKVVLDATKKSDPRTVDLSKDSSFTAQSLYLIGDSKRYIYAADGASFYSPFVLITGGSNVVSVSDFNNNTSVIASKNFLFENGSGKSSFISGQNSVLYLGLKDDLSGVKSLTSGLIGNDGSHARSIGYFENPITLWDLAGILIDGDITLDYDRIQGGQISATSGEAVVRNQGALYLVSNDTATSATKYLMGYNGVSAPVRLDGSSRLYLGGAGSIGDVTGYGSVYVNRDTGVNSSNQDVVMGNVYAKKLYLGGKVQTGNIDIASGGSLDMALGSSLASADITTEKIEIGSDKSNVSISADSLKLTDSLSVSGDHVSISADSLSVPTLTLSGDSNSIKVNNATLSGKIFNSQTSFTATGTLNFNGDIEVGEGADLDAGKLLLNGFDLRVDPDWSVNSSIVYTNSLSGAQGNELDGNLTVGQNSAFYLGTGFTNSKFNEYASSVVKQGSIGALAYFDTPVTVKSGYGILVDANGTVNSQATADTLSVAKNSAVVLRASDSGDTAAITFEAQNATVENNGIINVTGKSLIVGNTVRLFGNTSTNGSVNYLSSGGVIQGDGGLLTFTDTTTPGYYKIEMSQNATEILERYGLDEKTVESVIQYLKKHSLIRSVLIDAALNADSYGYGDPEILLGSLPRMNIASGLVQDSEMVGDLLYKSASERFNDERTGLKRHGLWVKPVYRHLESEDLSAGILSYGINSSLTGISAGYDTDFEKGGAGIAISAGNVRSHSTGDFVYTRGDYNYTGASLYGLYRNGGFKLLADLSYAVLTGNMTMNSPFGTFGADGVSKIALAGLKAGYGYDLTAKLKLTPFVSARYEYIKTDDTNAISYDDAIHFDANELSYVKTPAGVELSYHARKGRWDLGLSASLEGYWRFGDRDLVEHTRISGVPFTSSVDLAPKFGYEGALSFSARRGEMFFDAGYGYSGSSKTKSHSLYLKAEYDF